MSNELTPWSRILEKLIGPQPVKKSLHFMETEVALPCSQEPATCPYPESDESSTLFHPVYPLSSLALPNSLFP